MFLNVLCWYLNPMNSIQCTACSPKESKHVFRKTMHILSTKSNGTIRVYLSVTSLNFHLKLKSTYKTIYHITKVSNCFKTIDSSHKMYQNNKNNGCQKHRSTTMCVRYSQVGPFPLRSKPPKDIESAT